jgi:hypothetical protein
MKPVKIQNILPKIKWSSFMCFYTIWAIILHILYLNGKIGNTYPIALFVFLCSQIMAMINPKYPYIIPFEVLFHIIPLFIIPVSFENIDYLVYSFFLYLILINEYSIKLYIDPLKYLTKK